MRNDLLPFRGLVAAPHTPLDSRCRLNLDAVEAQARHLRRAGVRAVFIAGSTGEGPSLATEERIRLAQRWTEVARDHALRVMVHVGSNCLPEAQAMAARAESCGAHAISALAPFYFKPSTEADLAEYCAAIAGAAPGLPFYYYDYPGMTGVRLSLPDFLELAARRIPSLAGIKCSSGDLTQLQDCLHAAQGRLDILLGCDELLLAGWALGVRGAVGTTYNVAAPLYLEILEAFERGDRVTAARKQYEASQLVGFLARFGLVPATKAVMRMLGVDCGPVRPPLRNLSRSQLGHVRRKLRTMSAFRGWI